MRCHNWNVWEVLIRWSCVIRQNCAWFLSANCQVNRRTCVTTTPWKIMLKIYGKSLFWKTIHMYFLPLALVEQLRNNKEVQQPWISRIKWFFYRQLYFPWCMICMFLWIVGLSIFSSHISSWISDIVQR